MTDTDRPTYRERREAKAERLAEWAAKREAKAESGLARARELGSVIPFGQPIHVGHYSERGDRNYRGRVNATYDRAFADGDKARDMARRSEGIKSQLDHAIYSDDHDAIDKLRERIAGLEEERARIKAYNASCRKGARNLSILTERERDGLLSIAKVAPYSLGKKGEMPSYALSNLSGNIKRNRDRLAQLERKAAR